MGKSVAFHNLGCKVNSYETEKMMKELANTGYTIVPFYQRADIYIVNTCSVTNIADRKSRQMLHRAKKLNPDAVIVAAGCYVNTHTDREIRLEGVDICIANEQKKDIAEILNRYFGDEESMSCDPACSSQLPESIHTRCFIKVQDGCNQFCTYCIVPYARGRIRSRKVNEVREEVKRCVNDGYKEFVLSGIHISSYGKDRPDDREDLPLLIQTLSEIEGVMRIRLSSLEPRVITEEFVKTLCDIKQICPHFHLSLQSGSNTVLKRMNRHYTTEDYIRAVEILRKYFDDPAITTDIITGFPGETDEEFMETVDFVRHIDFYETHIFKYSRRKGTAADKMEGQISEKIKHERSVQLMDINAEKKKSFEDRYISGECRVEVLFEDTENLEGSIWHTGYTREYIKVYDDRRDICAGEIDKGIIKRKDGVVIFEGN